MKGRRTYFLRPFCYNINIRRNKNEKDFNFGFSFGLGSALFADTLHVMKSSMGTPVIHTYKNMKLDRFHSYKDNCYYYDSWGNLIYTVDGKTYITSMFEVELD